VHLVFLALVVVFSHHPAVFMGFTAEYQRHQNPLILKEALLVALVAGAVTGGGLAIIANARNPAGVSIFKDQFSDSAIHPAGLLLGGACNNFCRHTGFQVSLKISHQGL
jgi:hypothetical protein